MTQANEVPIAILQDSTGHPLTLLGVSIQAKLTETSASIEVEQRYRNPYQHNIEAVYTFPLPMGAVLLEMEVDIADQKLTGQVIEKKAAEQRYEAAITDGNSAVMVQALGNGLYSMNVGNLLAGETAVIRFRYALTLSWLGDQLRLTIPTTVAPRYGDAAATGLEPWQIPSSSLLVEYPFALTVSIVGKLADADIASPTHQIAIARTEPGLVVTLNQQAALDRDFVLTAKARSAMENSYLLVNDGEQHVALATLRIPPVVEPCRVPLCLKILIDCSGSMAGVSIAQARKAALAMLDLLQPEDCFNLTLFGDDPEHLFDRMVVADALNLDYARTCLTRLEANLGGTATGKALASVYRLRGATKPGLIDRVIGKKRPEPQNLPSVLLITDGEIWNTEEIITQAMTSKHQVFTVGVGMSVAESFVKTLASATGAACELVSPQEGMADKILAQFHRLQQPKFGQADVVWDVAPLWQTPIPTVLFAGDTLHIYAGFTSEAPGSVRLQMPNCAMDTSAIAAKTHPVEQPDIARLAAQARIGLSVDAAEQVELALRYQLLTDRTHFLVVAERQDKPDNLPVLAQVPQMLAAGWGGAGVDSSKVGRGGTVADADIPAVFRMSSSRRIGASVHSSDGHSGIPAFLRLNREAVSAAKEPKISAIPIVPSAFIQSLNLVLRDQVTVDALPSTLDELVHLGLPLDIKDALILMEMVAGPNQNVVTAFLHALAEGPLANLFDRGVKRLVLARWKREASDPRLYQWCTDCLLRVERTAWNWVIYVEPTLVESLGDRP